LELTENTPLPRPATVWRRIMGSIYESLLLFGPLLVVVVFLLDHHGLWRGLTRARPKQVKRVGLQIAVVGYPAGLFRLGLEQRPLHPAHADPWP